MGALAWALFLLECHAAVLWSWNQSEFREQILQWHNDFRAREASSDMAALTYDLAIERKAQAWAELCMFEHSNKIANSVASCRRGKCGQGLGENLWMGDGFIESDLSTIRHALNTWYGEKQFWSLNDGRFDLSNCAAPAEKAAEICGHYTQIVSSRSLRMGCAVASCRGKEWSTYLVCQYDPPGNVVGEQLFALGATCSACPMGHGSCTGGLCRGATPALPAQTVVMDIGCRGDSIFSAGVGDCTLGPPGGSWKSQVIRLLPIGQQWMAQLQFCTQADCEECRVARPQAIGECDSALNFPSAFRFPAAKFNSSALARVATVDGVGLIARSSPVVMFSTQLRVEQEMPSKLRLRSGVRSS
mmetsp:Transcript_50415/g.132787  ORF Transcript_50415/g.132787 Transcript_50415/m.132787 type:complete len:359 (+) Transcript_50415:49-1125(+)